MKKFLTLFFLLLYGICYGQNLVPNPSFETHTNCPLYIGGPGDLNYAAPWFRANFSPDYFNICDTTVSNLGVPDNNFGNQLAHSGVAYAGFYTLNLGFPNYGKEYIEVKLTDTLSAGVRYRVQFYVSLADGMAYSTNTIGAYFFQNSIIDSTIWPIMNIFNYIPQVINNSGNRLTDKNNWTLVSETFTAMDNEAYMMIGNFNLDSLSDTTFLGGSGFYSYYFIDDVSVFPDSLSIANENQIDTRIGFYPNPFKEKLNFCVNNYEPSEIIIYDCSSKKLLQQAFTNTTTLNTELLAKGMYFYEIRNKNGVFQKGKVIKE